MSKHAFVSIDEYLASQPEPTRALLLQVRAAIREGVPGAEETIAYNMPTFKKDGRSVLHFAGWQGHYSLYPATKGVMSELSSELAAYEIENGTIRFSLTEVVPVELIVRIAQLRAAEELQRADGPRQRASG